VSVFLQTQHLFLRDPRGGVEDVAAMAAAGFGAIFCNVGDHDPSEWQTIRGRAGAAGVICGPWLRTATSDNRFDYDRFHTLLEVADQWASPLIVNSESELNGTGSEITTYIDAQLGPRDAAISMETIPFANVEWWPLAERPVLPQLFLANVDADEPSVRELWQAYGVSCVVMTYGSYGGSVPGDYSGGAPFGVYTADDCGGDYQAWRARGTCSPCVQTPTPPDGGDVMEAIGSQDGINAFMDWLRAQPDVKPRGPGYKESDISTWPMSDKIERTLRILVANNDEQAAKT